jgi:hypothetical protein
MLDILELDIPIVVFIMLTVSSISAEYEEEHKKHVDMSQLRASINI